MKAVVTAAGLGTRSGLDGKFRKEMLPLYDMRDGRLVLRPVIDIVLTRVQGSGADEIAVVLQPTDSMTEGYVKREFPEVQIIYQEGPAGFGNAVYCAREFLGGDSLVHAGDAFMLDRERYLNMRKEKNSKLYLFHVENPSRYGNAMVDRSTGKIMEVREKPQHPMSNLALCAVYRFSFPLAPYVKENDTEFTLSIERALQAGENLYHEELAPDLWVSVGNAETYVEKVERTFRYNSKIKY